MNLRKQDQEFRNPKLFYPDAKNIDLDRVMINLFILLRCGGSRPVSRGRARPDVERVAHHVDVLSAMSGVSGFLENRHIAKGWLESDIFDLVNRGTPREAVSSLRPLHLDAHKIRVQRHCRDYNVGDAIYAFLQFGAPETIRELRTYLDRGRDPATGRYDGRTDLDIETLTVLKLVAELDNLHASAEKVAEAPPTCIGQARVLADDVQRLLAYAEVVPRPVMIDYLKTVFGLHVGLYTLRLAKQLTGWIGDKRPHAACVECPVHGSSATPFDGCPYQLKHIVDMGPDFRSRMAQLSQDSASAAYASLLDLIKGLFTMNQLLRYAREERDPGIPDQPRDVLRLLETPQATFESDFKAKLRAMQGDKDDDEELPAELQAILAAPLPAFERFIEVVTHIRQKHHRTYLVEMLDKLFQKNGPYGVLVQGKSGANPRRWQLGGRHLEVLVQLAVLRWQVEGNKRLFYSQPVLVEDFLHWVEARYGFVLCAPELSPESRQQVSVQDYRAYRDNVRALKDRLREIGFYDDLSDAYNAQTIRPRYPFDQRVPEA
jgi:hypothetical protein